MKYWDVSLKKCGLENRVSSIPKMKEELLNLCSMESKEEG